MEQADDPVLLIAEGLLMYFESHQVRTLLDSMTSAFPGAEMLLELLAPGAVGMAGFHDTMSKLNVEFKCWLSAGRELESWNSKIRFLQQWSIQDYHQERWQWLSGLTGLPWIRWWFGERIVRLRFEA